MDDANKTQTILFIKGVYIKDCIPVDDVFEKHMLDRLNINHNPVIYIKLPILFTSINKWITYTNICCWHCDLTFDNVPIFLPSSIEHYCNEYNICVSGCFCSFSCASAYNLIHNNKICDYIKYRDMLLLLYKIFHGKNVNEILPAPSKYNILKYGGNETVEQYKMRIYELTKKIKLLEY